MAKRLPHREIAKARKNLADVSLPDLKQVAGEFYHLIGGPKNFAMMLKKEFDASKEGGMVRARILDLVLQTTKAATAKEVPKDTNLLSDEDVDRELLEVAKKISSEEPKALLECLQPGEADHE